MADSRSQIPAKVMIIDDEQDIVRAFEQTLSLYPGTEVVVSTEAEEALKKAADEKPGVILLDLRMPGMNGLEVLKRLKKILPETRFMVMTGLDNDHIRQQVETLGVAAYYVKPIDLEAVINKILSLAKR
ncbi:MAG: hypothetical protein A2Z83_00435 [Omnitrophica bacterium GWA2_52_8]|nr:MAG: hypothetical protein A2Z83_00435 [Omnitrophica bacterium GWA2_52_8]